MIPKLHISVVSCFGIKMIVKNMVLVLYLFWDVNQKKVIPLSFHVKDTMINKKKKKKKKEYDPDVPDLQQLCQKQLEYIEFANIAIYTQKHL